MKYLANLLVMVCLVALAFAACTQQPQEIAEETPNTEADVEAIKAWFDRYAATVKAGDIDGYRAYWSEDVMWLPPNEPVREGLEAIMDYVRPLFEQFNIDETISVEEIKVANGFAFARVHYAARGTPKEEAEPYQEDGKAIFIFQQKPNGSWVSTRCIWNSNISPSE